MTALIESGRYLFTVQSVQTSGSRTVHVSMGYTLEANDSILTLLAASCEESSID